MSEYSKRRALEKLRQNYGARDKPYKYAEWREDLGIPTDDKKACSKLWNLHRRLAKDDVIEEVSDTRSRHKYYRIKDISELTRRAVAANGTGASDTSDDGGTTVGGLAGRGADRLSRIEERLSRIENGNAKVHATLEGLDLAELRDFTPAKLDAKIDALDAKLDLLVSIWS